MKKWLKGKIFFKHDHLDIVFTFVSEPMLAITTWNKLSEYWSHISKLTPTLGEARAGNEALDFFACAGRFDVSSHQEFY